MILADCVFCKIVKGEIPGQVVYENGRVLVIKDIHPAAPIHFLAIPKQHVNNICDPKLVDPQLSTEIFLAIQETARQEGLTDNGFRVVINFGRDAGETVPHLHFHLLAGRMMEWPPG